MRLYDQYNNRLYINPEERDRFIKAANQIDCDIRSFCLTLLYTGIRLSEARELTVAAVQLDSRLISVRCLKKRNRHVMREVPIPPALVESLEFVHGIRTIQKNMVHAHTKFLWSYNGRPLARTTAYRWVKRVMDDAGIVGMQASPKGLRHGYGIHAIRSGIQLHMLKKWMGHASMNTTAIYATAVGKEELALADRMW
nr:site-specific integrase [uncultured Cohaesibacter sp.]